MIVAMLINSPDLLIADEPTSALDVMVRGPGAPDDGPEIQRRGMGLILISHDLNTVARYCDRVLIMYKGKIVETCQADRLFEAQHPYTRGLLACLPSASTRGQNCRCWTGRPSKGRRADMADALLKVEGLDVFYTRGRQRFQAVCDVAFEIGGGRDLRTDRGIGMRQVHDPAGIVRPGRAVARDRDPGGRDAA